MALLLAASNIIEVYYNKSRLHVVKFRDGVTRYSKMLFEDTHE